MFTFTRAEEFRVEEVDHFRQNTLFNFFFLLNDPQVPPVMGNESAEHLETLRTLFMTFPSNCRIDAFELEKYYSQIKAASQLLGPLQAKYESNVKREVRLSMLKEIRPGVIEIPDSSDDESSEKNKIIEWRMPRRILPLENRAKVAIEKNSTHSIQSVARTSASVNKTPNQIQSPLGQYGGVSSSRTFSSSSTSACSPSISPVPPVPNFNRPAANVRFMNPVVAPTNSAPSSYREHCERLKRQRPSAPSHSSNRQHQERSQNQPFASKKTRFDPPVASRPPASSTITSKSLETPKAPVPRFNLQIAPQSKPQQRTQNLTDKARKEATAAKSRIQNKIQSKFHMVQKDREIQVAGNLSKTIVQPEKNPAPAAAPLNPSPVPMVHSPARTSVNPSPARASEKNLKSVPTSFAPTTSTKPISSQEKSSTTSKAPSEAKKTGEIQEEFETSVENNAQLPAISSENQKTSEVEALPISIQPEKCQNVDPESSQVPPPQSEKTPKAVEASSEVIEPEKIQSPVPEITQSAAQMLSYLTALIPADKIKKEKDIEPVPESSIATQINPDLIPSANIKQENEIQIFPSAKNLGKGHDSETDIASDNEDEEVRNKKFSKKAAKIKSNNSSDTEIEDFADSFAEMADDPNFLAAIVSLPAPEPEKIDIAPMTEEEEAVEDAVEESKSRERLKDLLAVMADPETPQVEPAEWTMNFAIRPASPDFYSTHISVGGRNLLDAIDGEEGEDDEAEEENIIPYNPQAPPPQLISSQEIKTEPLN